MKILEARDQIAVRIHGSGSYKKFIEKTIRARWNQTLFIDWANPAGEAVRAFINQSAWAVRCPDCGESIVTQAGEHLFCPNCLNVGNGYKPRSVVFPDGTERIRIEAALLKRLNPANRNWAYPETVADLVAENLGHGIEG